MQGFFGIESACQFDPTFWPVYCKLNIGTVLSDGLTGGKCTDDRVDPYSTSSCLFRRVDMIFFCYCCALTILSCNLALEVCLCFCFVPLQFFFFCSSSAFQVRNHITTVMHVVCCSRKTQIITSFIL